jgi:hypothetical protein
MSLLQFRWRIGQMDDGMGMGREDRHSEAQWKFRPLTIVE